MSEADRRWQFWIDRGGTFTDIVARHPSGQLLTRKLLSENPEQYQDAALQGISELLQLSKGQSLTHAIAVIKMGTTVGTNALLERKGEAVALLISKGLKDCLRIGYQNRPDIFALHIQLPELLYQTVIEINERLDAQGNILKALDLVVEKQQLQVLYDSGIRAVAIVLMHAWRYPQHELQLAELARDIGFSQISVSHQVSPLMKIISRGDTTVVDAYLSPLLRRYVYQIVRGIRGKASINETRLLFMQSNGGLISADRFQGKDCILSGPAGGIVGAVKTAKLAGFKRIIAFDMGGTSTDVAHYGGADYERSFETQVAGVRMRVPMMHIHTVAAGGGSLLKFDGLRYQVGPESAGANPGPASYRRGGPLTVTDANVMLGKLPLFPAILGSKGDQTLDIARVKQLFTQLAEQIELQTGDKRNKEQVAEGYLNIAVQNMATAIKKISVQRGYDVATYTLCCYGAAAGQHACKVADRLAMRQILIHPFAGVLSAYGMGLADFRLLKDQAIEKPLAQVSFTQLHEILQQLEGCGRQEMLQQGLQNQQISAVQRIFLRYQGTDTALQIDFSDKSTLMASFQEHYRQQFGFTYPDKALVIASVLVEIIAETEPITEPAKVQKAVIQKAVQPLLTTRIFTDNSWYQTPVFERDQLPIGCLIRGAAIIVESTGTIVIEPGWQAEVTERMDLLLSRIVALPRQFAIGTSVDPVMLEIFNKLFMSIAEQMGFVLQNTAYSVNIKERLDFSCAIFDNAGQLVANAPHIPVHLGAMGESVQALRQQAHITLAAGDVYLLNSPYQGGTHLPDITVVTPVFDGSSLQVLFYVAARGHHADVGGITPGSMPPDSLHINQEGLLHTGLKIVQNGVFMQQAVENWLRSGDYPARNPEQNIADLHAQIAANAKGVTELKRMVEHYSLATVQAYMQHVQDNAAESVRRVLEKQQGGYFSYRLDGGAKVVVTTTINPVQRTATIDFTGTSLQLQNNFNAPSAVCKAAVLYVFRTLVAADIPLNAGCLIPLEIIIPKGSMLCPDWPAAVVAGNVETSQYIVDALYAALGKLAASQGTMNNLTFGNERYQYYETICGGAGAGENFAGADAVQTHMTNSRMTDPEVLEWRYPVLLDEFSIRLGSGGEGQQQGGDGVLRRIKFLEPMTVCILSSHRKLPPFGMKGGINGQLGTNSWIRKNAEIKRLPACVSVEVDKEELIQIETPGGGGFGVKEKQ